VKILFDENLSPKLVQLLADLFPGSESVLDVGLAATPDSEILKHAVRGGFCVATKDRGYRRMALAPESPKIIWIRAGNCGTRQIADLLRRFAVRVAEFERSSAPFLVLE
jgi:predicted nuclease of predicted toxin-antitoxin system